MAPLSKKLIDSANTAVTDMLEGLLLATPHLKRLDGFPHIKVIFREHDGSKVALISGGGSGHEPAHAGYVGTGMLAAAVCGDVFASPSAAAVLAAIKTVTGPAGCLLIVKNYTGDRLHFGLAAEQAKAQGYKVDMVVVGEDCAIDAPGLAGRRGLAGTVYVHKLAGAAAEQGQSLEQVAAVARQAAGSMGTLGVALTVCTLPGQRPSDRLAPDEIEVGLGIHGEPGVEKMPWQPVSQLVPSMLARITAFGACVENAQALNLKPGSRVALLVNNLGGSPPMELYIVAKAAVEHLRQHMQVSVERLHVGPFMTSLDMAGASLTLLSMPDDTTLTLLDAPTNAPGWPTGPATLPAAEAAAPTPLPPLLEEEEQGQRGEEEEGGSGTAADGKVLGSRIKAAAEALLGVVEQLNEYDRKVGDGDCGDTLRHGAEAILAALNAGQLQLHSPAATLRQLARAVRASMGGTSGGLYDVGLTCAATAMAQHQQQEQQKKQQKEQQQQGAAGLQAAEAWAAALGAGVGAVERYGGAGRGNRTMLDALIPAQEALQTALNSGSSPREAALAAAAAAQAGAEETKHLKAGAGRSGYVPAEMVEGVPDPGAVAAATWLNAVVKAGLA